jgi:hypothetical protein
MSTKELSLLLDLGCETVCLPMCRVLLKHIIGIRCRHRQYDAQRTVFVQINVFIQGAGAEANDETNH